MAVASSFVAPAGPDLVSTGHGTVVWVIDTSTLQRIAEVSLPAPAFDSAPLPDGGAMLASNTNTQDPDERTTRLIEAPTGRELARWSGGLVGIEVQQPAQPTR